MRWRYGVNVWESSYLFAACFGFGMALSAHFIGLSASAPRHQLGTAIGIYYLCQQLGEILGVGIAAAVLRADFHHTLKQRLGNGPVAKRVCVSSFFPIHPRSAGRKRDVSVDVEGPFAFNWEPGLICFPDGHWNRSSPEHSKTPDSRHVCRCRFRRWCGPVICMPSSSRPVS